MKFLPSLKKATLIQRYKRFLADIKLPCGKEKTIHCANTGAMTGCGSKGDTIWYSTSNNPKRKYPNSWEITQNSEGHKICVNTARANQLAIEAIKSNRVKELLGYQEIETEVNYGIENSRIDILLKSENEPNCYIEVKSVTLMNEDGQGYFPDTVTTRGQKHLRELTEVALSGSRAVLFFTVLHSGIEKVAPAHHIDAKYSQLLNYAIEHGVEVLCYKAEYSADEIELVKPIKFNVLQ